MDPWVEPRRVEVARLIALLEELSSLNRSSGAIDRLPRVIVTAEELLRDDLRCDPPRFGLATCLRMMAVGELDMPR
jgi:hypothetical protein